MSKLYWLMAKGCLQLLIIVIYTRIPWT